MITAYAEMLQPLAEARLPGVDFMISKPFLLENLREAISRATPAQKKELIAGTTPSVTVLYRAGTK